MDNTLRTRISLKYDTAENWKLSTLQLDKGEVIVYAGGNGEPPKFKVGDGTSTLPDSLPFAGSDGLPKGGTAGDFLKLGADGKAVWQTIGYAEDNKFGGN